ncbi:MAG: S26 family signal peptidase, partial [Actinomycetota bacterium]
MGRLNDFRKHPVVDLVITVAIAVGIAYLVQAFIVKPYRVPSGSMEPTIAIGER